MLLTPLASAKLQLESEDEASQGYLLNVGQELTTHIPFSLSRDGGFYAKMLVTPWNPVNDNTPNGTLGEDGWRVEFFFLGDDGELLERDAKGQDVQAEQGERIDSTPTDVIPLPANTPYRLGVTVHMPKDAAIVDGYYDIPVALVFRDLEGDSVTASGAGLEQSQGFRVIIDWNADVSSVATPGAPQPTEPLEQGPEQQEPTPVGDRTLTFLPEVNMLWWVLLAIILILFIVRREIQLHRLRKDMESILVGLQISGFYEFTAARPADPEALKSSDGTPPPDIVPSKGPKQD